MIDGVAVVDPEVTSQKKSSTIQLLVKESQYIVLDTAANLGKLRLALCPPEQQSNSRNREDNGEDFMDWLNQSETSEVNINPPIIETVQLPVERKAKPEGHEMTIVTSTKSTRYKMVNGQMAVLKDGEPEADVTELSEGYPGAGYTPYSGPSKSNPDAGANSTSPQATISTPPVDPDVATQPNLIWDSVMGVWQSGGFKATYPRGK